MANILVSSILEIGLLIPAVKTEDWGQPELEVGRLILHKSLLAPLLKARAVLTYYLFWTGSRVPL